MTLHTPKAPETTVQRMVTNAMHVQNIEVETGRTRDDIKACAMRMGYALDAASQRFRRAPQRKPAPAGIVLASQTSTGAADTGQPASDPSHDRDTNSGRGGEPSSSVPVLPHTSGEEVRPSRGDDSAIANPLGSFVETSPSPEPDPVIVAAIAFVRAFADLLAAIEPTTEPATPPSTPTKRPGNYPTGPRLTHGATQSQIRDWARTQGLDVNPRGTVRRDIADAYAAAHQETP